MSLRERAGGGGSNAVGERIGEPQQMHGEPSSAHRHERNVFAGAIFQANDFLPSTPSSEGDGSGVVQARAMAAAALAQARVAPITRIRGIAQAAQHAWRSRA
eukprot:TRINITY_DN924_c0_g1_i6.p2 TRINITY_DN924_c0_g1~~TRINITY_DN924_c0_g1_i6.p2  ORF type:complete len:102 (+),score=16.86 TRINITY_DN924_c0_g1_i6:164-469(+)